MHIVLSARGAVKYPAKEHARRVAAQLGCKRGLIYLLGQYAFNREDSDMPKTWFQRRFFYYLSGVDEPNACLTYNCATDELVLYIEEIDWDNLIWTGRGSTIEEAKERYDVDDVRLNPQLFRDIRYWRDHRSVSEKFYILHPEQVPKGIDDLPIDKDRLLHAIDECRAIKDQHEVELIKRANVISTAAHLAVLHRVASAGTEADLSAVFQGECIARLAPQAYPPIVGSGANASTLHYTSNNESLQGRQLVCLDAAAASERYAADVTRTFPINGHWTEEARAIYELVLKIQTDAIKATRPGVYMLDLHKRVAHQSIAGLLSLGILHNGSVDEIEAAGTIRGFYPHGLGHHLGLETHDCQSVPLLRYAASRRVNEELPSPGGQRDVYSLLLDPCRTASPALAPGNVVTIEPGLYFNKQYLQQHFLHNDKHARYINQDVLEKFWAVGGVRIEDNILITEEGNTNLTTAPKLPDELSRIITGKC